MNTSSNKGHPSNSVHNPSSVISVGLPPTSGERLKVGKEGEGVLGEGVQGEGVQEEGM